MFLLTHTLILFSSLLSLDMYLITALPIVLIATQTAVLITALPTVLIAALITEPSYNSLAKTRKNSIAPLTSKCE